MSQHETNEFAAVRQKCIERRAFVFTDLVSWKLAPEERFNIIDGGAREALSDPRWQCIDPNRVTLYGFEPDPVEVKKLKSEVAQQGLDYQYFPGALWSCDASLTFHENQSPGGSSFFNRMWA